MQTILYISPDTFGYYKAIGAAIERAGAKPIWLNQLPSTSIASRVFFRLAPNLARRFAKGAFERQLDQIEHVDQILIIKGEGVSGDTIASMRRRYPGVRIVFYLWDSIANTPGAERKIELCDAALSFDPVDCDRIAAFEHLPLFHSEDPGKPKPAPRHGFAAFIGTLHSNRYEMIRTLGGKIEALGAIKPFIYFYYPNKILFSILRLIHPGFRKVRAADVKFEPVPREQYNAIQDEAEILIDICHPRQSGLTMRTIEALGSGKKLVTNNQNVRRYDFFCPENYFVVEGGDYSGLKEFLDVPYNAPSAEMIARYHIDSWLGTLLATDRA
jgi:hypothetical protein